MRMLEMAGTRVLRVLVEVRQQKIVFVRKSKRWQGECSVLACLAKTTHANISTRCRRYSMLLKACQAFAPED
jgi:hypothetical protein